MMYSQLNWVGQAAWNHRSGLSLPLTGGEPTWRYMTSITLNQALRWLVRAREWAKCKQVAAELDQRRGPVESEAA